MKTRRAALATALTLVLAGVAATPSAQAQQEVTIGYSGPLSGGAALYGKNVLEGIEMAIGEINAAGLDVGGKKVTLKVVALDDQYNPSQTAINAQRLVQQNKAAAMLVPHSGGIFAVMTRNQQQKLLLLAYSSVPRITEQKNQLTVRVTAPYTAYVDVFVKYGIDKLGKTGAMAETDSDYGKAWSAAFQPAWEKAGGKIAIHNALSYNKSADFYAGVSRVLAEKPDAILIGGPSEPTGLVVKQARELGFKGGFMLIDQAKLEEVQVITGGYEALNGSVGILPLDANPSADVKGFIARYHKIHKDKTPTYEQALNYINVHALAQAMKLAGSTSDASAIRAQMDAAYKALPPAVNFFGFEGVDADGATRLKPLVGVVEDGKVRQITAD